MTDDEMKEKELKHQDYSGNPGQEKKSPKGGKKNGKHGKGKDKGKGKGKSCPNRSNNPDWYTADGAPLIGANFAVLQNIAPERKTGLRLDSIFHVRAGLVLPNDPDDSFFTKATKLYEEIREKNSGAANYDAYAIMAYEHNYRVAAALQAHLDKCIAALKATMKSYANSSNVIANACGIDNYASEVVKFANTINQATLINKRLNALPMIPLRALKMDSFRYGTLFLDSQSAKPAMLSFVPTHVFYVSDYASKDNAATTGLDCTRIDIASNTSAIMAAMDTVLDTIESDPIMDILRGDLRNAYGSESNREYILSSLRISVEDPEVMSQLENMNISAISSGFSASDWKCEMAAGGKVTVQAPLSGMLNDPIKTRMTEQNFLINWHKQEAPTPGELMAITRLMPTAAKTNGLTSSYWDYDLEDGNIYVDIYYLKTTPYGASITQARLSDAVTDAQSSGNQSTMKAGFQVICMLASNFDHFPLIYTSNSAPSTGYEYMWDVDNFAILDKVTLETITTRVIRSLYDTHPPRGEHGRKETKA